MTAQNNIANDLMNMGIDMLRVEIDATMRPNSLKALSFKFGEAELLAIGAIAIQQLITERVDSVERQLWLSIRDKAMMQMEAL